MHTELLLKMLQEGELEAESIITHRVPLERASEAYDTFNKREDKAVKFVLKPGMQPAIA